MRNYRGRAIAFSFVLLSIGSSIYVSVAALNYLTLYPALDQIQIQIVRLSFLQNANTNQSTLTTFITVNNPTGYSGFRIGAISVAFSLYSDSNRSISIFSVPNDLVGSSLLSAQLPPNSVYSTSIPVYLTPQQANQTAYFISHFNGRVGAETVLTVGILTFLESVTGAVPYIEMRDIPLSFS